jgi:hypothetical protein
VRDGYHRNDPRRKRKQQRHNAGVNQCATVIPGGISSLKNVSTSFICIILKLHQASVIKHAVQTELFDFGSCILES